MKLNIINKFFSCFVSHKKRVVTDEIRDALPIKPSRTAKFIGFSPFPVGLRPQKVTGFNEDAINFLNKPGIKEKYPEVDKISRKYAVEISWISQIKEFQALCDPNVKGEKYTSKEILEKSLRHIDRIKLPDLPKPDPVNCLKVRTNKDAYAGKMSEIYYERSNHGYVDQYIKPIAVEYNERIMTNLVPDQSIWTIGGRVRFMGEDKLGSDLRCRVLIMPEGVNKIVGLNTVESFYDGLVNIQKVHPENEICLGTSFIGGNFFKFHDVNKEFDNVIEADLKRYDQSATEEQIVAAFSILRSCYPEGDDVDLLFLHHCSSFIFKNIVIPGGFVFRLSKGIATGSPFTSAIGSILNWMNWTRVADSLGFELNRQIRVYGDDTLLFFNGFSHISLPELVSLVLEETGFTTDPLLIKRVNDPPWGEKPYSFLKTYSSYGFPCKDFFDTVERVLFPEFAFKCRIDRIEAIDSVFYVSPFNYRALRFVSEFKKFLLESIANDNPKSRAVDHLRLLNPDDLFLECFLKGALLHVNQFCFYEERKFNFIWELRKKGKKIHGTSKFYRIDKGILSDMYILKGSYPKLDYVKLREHFPNLNFKNTKKDKLRLINTVYFNISYGKAPIDEVKDFKPIDFSSNKLIL